MGIVVIYAVRPREGQKEVLRALLDRHVPALRQANLITGRDSLLLWGSKDRIFVESFEWISEDAARRAESIPAIQEIWSAMAQIADFVPLASLTETAKLFSHFEPV